MFKKQNKNKKDDKIGFDDILALVISAFLVIVLPIVIIMLVLYSLMYFIFFR